MVDAQMTTVLLQANDRLGGAIERRLLQAGCQVTKLPQGNACLEALKGAMPGPGSVLILAADDDAGNVDGTLTARRFRPDVPLVVRVFDEALAEYLRNTLDRLTVLSMSGAATSAFESPSACGRQVTAS